MTAKDYKQILKLFPDFKGIPQNENESFYPELGPLIFIDIIEKNTNKVVIQVFDSKITSHCHIERKDMITKSSKFEADQIIFLFGVNVIDANGIKKLKANSVYTLKEVNDGLIKPSDRNNNIINHETTSNKEFKMPFTTLNERWKMQGKIL